ncbi:MAG: DUF1638 domain-containing protein [Spirochaetales bacterium]|nr:DUF1638 domain-containing protein [Spirochaetales bacterium]
MELLSCGILKNEINLLIKNNNWDITPAYLCSSLHVDFGKLKSGIQKKLAGMSPTDPKIIVYGTCHPQIDSFYRDNGGIRTEGQNCIELLLGHERFQNELAQGAFFLMEDWARRWDYVTRQAFGENPEGMKEIFRDSHKYFLAINTPCSGDFRIEAEAVSRQIGLPLRWLDTDLRILEEKILTCMKEADVPR